MRSLSLSIEHQLGQPEARRRLEAWLAEHEHRPPDLGHWTWQWSDDTTLVFQLRHSGYALSGKLQLQAPVVQGGWTWDRC